MQSSSEVLPSLSLTLTAHTESTDGYLYSQASWQSRSGSAGNTIPSLSRRYPALFRPELHTLLPTDLFPCEHPLRMRQTTFSICSRNDPRTSVRLVITIACSYGLYIDIVIQDRLQTAPLHILVHFIKGAVIIDLKLLVSHICIFFSFVFFFVITNSGRNACGDFRSTDLRNSISEAFALPAGHCDSCKGQEPTDMHTTPDRVPSLPHPAD